MKYELTQQQKDKLNSISDAKQRERLRAMYERRGQEELDAERAAPAASPAAAAVDKTYAEKDLDIIRPDAKQPGAIAATARDGAITINVLPPPAQSPPDPPTAALPAAHGGWRQDVGYLTNMAIIAGFSAMLGAIFLAPVLIKHIAKVAAALR